MSLARVPAGFCHPRREDTYRFSVNVGAAAWGTCREPGGGQRYRRTPGSINFAPAGSVIAWELESPMDLLKLSLPRSLIKAAARDLEVDLKALDFESAIQAREAQVEWLARALRLEVAAGQPNGLLFRESLGLALSIVTVRRFAHILHEPAAARGRLMPAQLQHITDYVHDNLSRQDLSLMELASITGTSLSNFKSIFKRSAGLSAHQFVVKCRVERAVVLLRAGKLSVSEVAAESGFTHASHLARWTRRLLGVSPRNLTRS